MLVIMHVPHCFSRISEPPGPVWPPVGVVKRIGAHGGAERGHRVPPPGRRGPGRLGPGPGAAAVLQLRGPHLPGAGRGHRCQPGCLPDERHAHDVLERARAGRRAPGRRGAGWPDAGRPVPVGAAGTGRGRRAGLLPGRARLFGHRPAPPRPAPPPARTGRTGSAGRPPAPPGTAKGRGSSPTLASGGPVDVRSVSWYNRNAAPGPYEFDQAWYDPRAHDANFVVLMNPATPLDEIADWEVCDTFGRPIRTYDVGPYVIMTYDTNLLSDLSPSRSEEHTSELQSRH